MKALFPDGHGSVVMRDAPEPTPTADEAVVSVSAYSVNRGETFLLRYPQPGWRPGKDVSGLVLRAAADGTGPGFGERVVGHPDDGGWAERAAVPTSKLAVLPDQVSAQVAAALPLAGLTALRLMRTVGSLAGRRVLLTGASGGVGHYVVELAAAQGAVLTAVVGVPDRGARLLELGAAEVVTDIATAEGPFDVVVESVGGELFPVAWSKLAHRGLFVWMGQASGERPLLDFFDWSGGSNATLRKFLYSESDTSDGEDLATLLRLVAGGHLHAEVGRIDDWRQTPAVLRALLSREIRGNAIVEVTT